jgi:hypothetical protein
MMHLAKVLGTPKGSGAGAPSAKSYFNGARGMASLRGIPLVLGETCWEEPREWIVMEICGEVVQRPFQVSYHIPVSLLQGGQDRIRTPWVWAQHPTLQAIERGHPVATLMRGQPPRTMSMNQPTLTRSYRPLTFTR